LQNGLSVIAEPKNSRGSYADWLGKKPPNERQKICALIDENLIVGQSFGEFLAKLKRAGCEVKIGKHTAVRLPGGKKNIRFDSCGEDYTDAAIDERLRGVRDVAPRVKSDEDAERKAAEYAAATRKSNAPNLLIDIQAKIREGKGAGYEQ
jgi:hypothetical protein